jgi:peptide/nickel transport system substrate-binding protein
LTPFTYLKLEEEQIMRIKSIPWVLVSLLVVFSMLLTACGGPAAEGEMKTLTITYFEEPDSLNFMYTDMWFATITMDLFIAGLWAHNDESELVPVLAAEIPSVDNGGISEDGTILTVKLRQDAKWSDGTQFTAADVAFTYEMIVAPGNTPNSRYPYADYVTAVTALDDYTIKIEMNDSFVAWPVYFFHNMLPKHILEPVFEAEGTIDNAEWNRNPTVGIGPYIFKEWVAASHLVFEANPDFWLGEPKIDQVYFRIVPDTEAQMAALSAGDSDLGVYMSAADKPAVDAMANMKLVGVQSGFIESWFFNLDANTGHPALQDVRVRQAIAMGVDRQKIINELFYGLYEIPPTFWYGMPYENPAITPYAYDPAAAMALLDEAGWVDSNNDGTRDKEGVELVLRYSTTAGHELREASQVVIQQMLADIGIGIRIINYSYDTIWNSYGDGGEIALGQYDIAEWSDGPFFPDPDTYYFLCSEIPTDEYPDGGNWYGICDEELDALFQAQAIEVDMDARIEMFYRIGQIMHDMVYWFGLRSDPDLWAVNTLLTNVRLSGTDPYWNLYEWDFVETTE